MLNKRLELGITFEEANQKLAGAIGQCSLPDNIINIKKGGNNCYKYTTVATRTRIFREQFGCYGRFRIITTHYEDPIIRKKAIIEILIKGLGWTILAEGESEESRNVGFINPTSLVENCETSCIGRALANLGIHGGEYASLNEIETKANQKKVTERVDQEKQKLADIEYLSEKQKNDISQARARLTKEELEKLEARFLQCKNQEELQKTFLTIGNLERLACMKIKDEMKIKLNTKSTQ